VGGGGAADADGGVDGVTLLLVLPSAADESGSARLLPRKQIADRHAQRLRQPEQVERRAIADAALRVDTTERP